MTCKQVACRVSQSKASSLSSASVYSWEEQKILRCFMIRDLFELWLITKLIIYFYKLDVQFKLKSSKFVCKVNMFKFSCFLGGIITREPHWTKILWKYHLPRQIIFFFIFFKLKKNSDPWTCLLISEVRKEGRERWRETLMWERNIS